MDFIQDIFQYKFLSNALIACILSGIACGLTGSYIVCRRMVFLSGGITHASFGGIGIAYYMGLNPIYGAVVFAIMSAVGVDVASRHGKIREDSAIGIIWSVGMALGIIFIYITPGYAPNLMSFLFGNILMVNSTDIIMLSVLNPIILFLFTATLRPVIFAAFDPDFARSQGMPVGWISIIMSVVVALTIVLSIRVVGIMLLISLLTIPAVIVNSATKSYRKIFLWSAVTAVSGNIVGLYFSYRLNIPVGATTIFVLAIALIIVKLLPLLIKKRVTT